MRFVQRQSPPVAHRLGKDATKRIVEMWLNTEFTGQRRHQRRIEKVHAIENDIGPTQPSDL